MKVVLDGIHLPLCDVVSIARGKEAEAHPYPIVVLDDAVKTKLRHYRSGLEARMEAGDIIYGVNTGCGIRKNILLPAEEIKAYQRYYIPAHCVGTGECFSPEIVRAVMALRVHSFAKGNSGVRWELCEKILELLNKNVIPFVPQQGSVGASGDLCPLAHIGATLTGVEKQEAFYQGQKMLAPEALKKAGITPIVLEAKEAMGLTNGATFILAIGILNIYDAWKLVALSTIAAALSLEAIRGEKAAFDERIHKARNHPGQIQIARQILALTEGSQRMTEECRNKALKDEIKQTYEGKPIPRIQDAYSFRCYPQVAGMTYDVIPFLWNIFQRETDASTDNPLLFPVDESDLGKGFHTLSGGNFHGEPLAQASDMLKISVQALANISDRRFFSLLMPKTSYGLPPDLAGKSFYNTGLMILQYTTAALVSENKVLCHPASVDSIPTSANQEDEVSMGTIAARHARQVIDNTYAIIAAEILAACQGISLTQAKLGNPRLGKGTHAALECVRRYIPEMEDDRYLYSDFQKMIELLKNDVLLHVVKNVVDEIYSLPSQT